jgi:ATP-dependent DNA ligase
MLATLARELPVGSDLTYEPKWDGFRCLAFCDNDGVDLRSRNERSLARYFPEVVAGLQQVAPVVLDGELVISIGGRSDFPALMARLHPAASRVAQLAGDTPASYAVFDVLAIGDADLRMSPYAERRAALERLLTSPPAPLLLTPTTTDPAVAARWLDAQAGSGVDGVVVKPADLRYEAGRRTMVKVKRVRTADCVVAGLRVHVDGGVGSLLLGLYDGDVLRHVGVVAQLPKATREEMRRELSPLVRELAGHPWEHGFGLEGGALGRLKGTAGRWVPGMTQDWLPVRPERVAEVGYDHVEGWRFRHPARFVRWRPDRDAVSCTVDQLA